MRVTNDEEHGMRLMMGLAEEGGQMTVADLAARERLPEPTVARLLGRLRQGELVSAVRGRNGGYELARAATAVTVGDVFRALERPLLGGRFCGDEARAVVPCPHTNGCGLRPVWQRLEALIGGVLDETTLADLLRSELKARRTRRPRADGDEGRETEPTQQESAARRARIS